jgi:hypothetical protein
MDAPEIITLREAALLVRLSEAYLRRLFQSGRVPGWQLKKHGRIFFNKPDLVKWWRRGQSPVGFDYKLAKFQSL